MIIFTMQELYDIAFINIMVAMLWEIMAITVRDILLLDILDFYILCLHVVCYEIITEASLSLSFHEVIEYYTARFQMKGVSF